MTYNEKLEQLGNEMKRHFDCFSHVLENLSVKNKKKLWEEYGDSVGYLKPFSEDDFDDEVSDIRDWLAKENFCCENENLFSDWKTEYQEIFDKTYECQTMVDSGKGNEEVGYC